MMTQLLFDKLVEISQKSISDTQKDVSALESMMPDNLTSALRGLLDFAEGKLGREKSEELVAVVKSGIDAWYASLTESERAKLGMAKTEQPDSDPKAMPTTKIDDFEEDPNDPDPALAQQRADAYAASNGTNGYTPMTAHGLGGGNSKESPQRAGRPKKNPQKRQRSRRRRGGGGGGGAGRNRNRG